MMPGIILDKLGAGKARSLLNLHRYKFAEFAQVSYPLNLVNFNCNGHLLHCRLPLNVCRK
jgi:hypothetical protein